MTQWFPKPAVYDKDGWHPMPYLDYGEFYSEFGSYEVAITLPENYTVAATGILETEAEVARLKAQAKTSASLVWSKEDPAVYASPDFPPSATQWKTITFKAAQVHDFAWFADKRFHVLHDTLHLTGRIIDTWAFFTDQEADLWQKAPTYIKQATRFYSDKIGDYPYPQVTAVQSALSAGAGMEYPMVTVIGLSGTAKALDQVIAHEVGHNWFYGILATNERDHAWLDEGFNSYYDHRYSRLFYHTDDYNLPSIIKGSSQTTVDEIGYRMFSCQHLHQAPDTPSEDMTQQNYWVGAYSVPARALRQLEAHWGQDKLDRAMKAYFKQWQFRHPGVEDAQEALETAGNESLTWLFQGFMQSTQQQDYTIKQVKNQPNAEIVLRNSGTIAGPLPVVAILETGDSLHLHLQGFQGDTVVSLPSGNVVQQIALDPYQHTMDIHRHNNYWRKGLWGYNNPPQLRLLTGLKDESHTTLFLFPTGGYNAHDGAMGGVGIHNRGILPQAFEWVLAPAYSIRAKEWVGMGGFRWRHWLPASRSRIREWGIAGGTRRFHFNTYEVANLPLRYQRAHITASTRWHPKNKTAWQTFTTLQYLIATQDDLVFSDMGVFAGTRPQQQQQIAFTWNRYQQQTLSPTHWRLTLAYNQYEDDFTRNQQWVQLQVEGDGKIGYEPDKFVSWRVYGGASLYHTLGNTTYTPAQSFSAFDRGRDDYAFRQLYIDRTADTGWASRQLGRRMGGVRVPVSAAFPLGRSNDWMLVPTLLLICLSPPAGYP
ncbi:MAG: M1 family metallopeptidase [Saprospiraceae bacterium]